ncbi:DNA adenine methylase [Synechocystis salina LEGE 06099]|uniref:DNA adenine methylase n=1 Tax=Synechocystis salina TaxID=945780 RepID=UPI001881971A|nr:DNA adenine methylase [Synechocystis salina]MBE9203314.1 DNA adenine methylase [Synechocystis salina LEGE 06099]
MFKIKSPLRYPGGKSKALKQILPHVPTQIKEYREPFIGGGSVFLAIKQTFDQNINKYRINDLNFDLYCFWKYAQEEIERLTDAVAAIKQQQKDGRKLFATLTKDGPELDEFQRAVRFFVLNRITFSGTVESGGYSQQAFEKRFTDSSIVRLKDLGKILANVTITNLDYQQLIDTPGEGVFIFLDPPYLSATKSKLYGKKGDLHTSFDHQRFAETMKSCPHKWLITYDDSEEIRKLFSFAQIIEWDLQYGMNNYKQEKASKGKELMIKNY